MEEENELTSTVDGVDITGLEPATDVQLYEEAFEEVTLEEEKYNKNKKNFHGKVSRGRKNKIRER